MNREQLKKELEKMIRDRSLERCAEGFSEEVTNSSSPLNLQPSPHPNTKGD